MNTEQQTMGYIMRSNWTENWIKNSRRAGSHTIACSGQITKTQSILPTTVSSDNRLYDEASGYFQTLHICPIAQHPPCV